MNTTQEFRAAVEAVLGRPLEADSVLIETSFGSLRVTLKPGAPAILLRFSTPGEAWEAEALRAGINPQSGGWDISGPARVSEDLKAIERKSCVRTLQRRLALAGYVPPPKTGLTNAEKDRILNRWIPKEIPDPETGELVVHMVENPDYDPNRSRDPLDAPMDLTLPADALLAAVRGTGDFDYTKLRLVLLPRFDDDSGGPFLACSEDSDPVAELCRAVCTDPEALGQRIVECVNACYGEPATGLPALALTSEEKRLLTELLTNAVEIPVAYSAGGHMAAIVGKTQDTFRGLLAKLEAL